MLSPRLTPKEERAFAFADDVLKQAAAFVGAAVAEVVFEDNADPKLYSLALLCRSISNFQGALTMARRNQAVECRTLVRSCIEELASGPPTSRRRGRFCEDPAKSRSMGHNCARRVVAQTPRHRR